jgi:hypothetical protein
MRTKARCRPRRHIRGEWRHKMSFNKGTRFKLHDKIYIITGTGQLRKKYFYNIKDEFNKAFSISRKELLEGLQEGLVTILE